MERIVSAVLWWLAVAVVIRVSREMQHEDRTVFVTWSVACAVLLVPSAFFLASAWQGQ